MRVFKQKEPLFSMSDTEPQLRTSYNQQEAETNERGAKRAAVQQQVDLQAWLFGLIRLAPQAERKAPGGAGRRPPCPPHLPSELPSFATAAHNWGGAGPAGPPTAPKST